MDSVESKFNLAIQTISNLPPDDMQPSTEDKLQFYGLYKQATIGDNKSPKPAFYDLVARAKWDAWSNLKGSTAENAMKGYVDRLVQLLKRFSDRPQALELVNQLENLSVVGEENVEDLNPPRTSTPEAEASEASYYDSLRRYPQYQSYMNSSPRQPDFDAQSTASSSYTVTPAYALSKNNKQIPLLPQNLSPIKQHHSTTDDVMENESKSNEGGEKNSDEKLEIAQKALEIMQNRVAALTEQLERFRIEEQQKHNAELMRNRKWSWLPIYILKTISKHILFNTVFLVLAVIWMSRSKYRHILTMFKAENTSTDLISRLLATIAGMATEK